MIKYCIWIKKRYISAFQGSKDRDVIDPPSVAHLPCPPHQPLKLLLVKEMTVV